MNRKIKLSVLDQSPIRKGGSAEQAIKETVELATLAERLGYYRFWVSEHHNFHSLAGSSPEVLIAHLGAATSKIRLGSGGVMLPNHSTLKVAENFRMLETLHPGRIDLGIGRAPGGDRLTSRVLNPSNNFGEDEFVQQVIDLQQYLYDTETQNRQKGSILAIPVAGTAPDIWLLTSSGGSAMIAAHFGLAISFAQFINPNGAKEVIEAYRERFKPSRQLKKPLANFAIIVACADTEEKAKELEFSTQYQLLLLEKGIIEGYKPFDEIKDYEFSAMEKARADYNSGRMICGTPGKVKKQLTQLADEYDVDEIVVVTITYDFKDRLRSYELLSEAFELESRNI